MARSKPEPTPEELEERRERYDAYLAEAVVKPLGWFKHDADAHDDPKLQDLRDMLGMAGYGRYWLLVEVLAGREAHQYAVEDRATGRDRWARLAMELEFDGGITQAKAFVGMLDELGLVDRELLEERGTIAIRRLADNAYEMAEATAKRRLGAWRTNKGGAA